MILENSFQIAIEDLRKKYEDKKCYSMVEEGTENKSRRKLCLENLVYRQRKDKDEEKGFGIWP